MLLLVTNKDDLAADYLITRLEERGIPFFRLNSDEAFELGISALRSSENSSSEIRIGRKSVSKLAIQAVWYRRSVFPAGDSPIPPEMRMFAAQEVRHLLEAMLPDPSAVRWVNPMGVTERAERKLVQLEVAASCGLAIPRTLVSNDTDELREFVETEGRIICKPISQGLLKLGTSWHAVHTREVAAADFSVQDMSRLPTLLQQLIPKGVDIRLTIIGDDYFPVAIESPEGSGVDWRAIPDQVSYSVCEMPPSLIDACYELMRQLGLLYGALDFVRSDDGDYYFLEVNPAGEWAWLESALGLPMRDALIRTLGIQ